MVEWEFVDALAAEFEGCKFIDGKDKPTSPMREWCLNGKAVAWERPLSKKDLAAMRESAPKGRVMAVHMPDLLTRDAWVQTVPGPCFVSPHFAKYPAVLVDMELADEQLVRELFDDGVLAATANERKG
jgi:hypothetical protein